MQQQVALVNTNILLDSIFFKGYFTPMAKSPKTATPPLSEAQVRATLAAVEIKGKKRDLLAEGIVSGIVVKDGHVGFSLEVDGKNPAASDPIKQAAEAAIRALPGVLSATALLTAHRRQQQPTRRPSQNPQTLYQPAKHIIAVASGKGGVGKSTTAVNLGLALVRSGQRVALLDADIYGPSLPKLLGVKQKPLAEAGKIIPIHAHGMAVMSLGFLLGEAEATIWRGPMVMSALEQMLRDVAWDKAKTGADASPDIMVIDMPPGTGDAQLTIAQRTRLSGAVIVSTPQDLALIDARKGLAMFAKTHVPVLGIVENMSYFVCPKCGSSHDIFSRGGAEAEAKRLGVPFLGAIPLEMDIRRGSDAGKPIVAAAPDSASAAAYMAIAQAVLAQLDRAETKPAPSININ